MENAFLLLSKQICDFTLYALFASTSPSNAPCHYVWFSDALEPRQALMAQGLLHHSLRAYCQKKYLRKISVNSYFSNPLLKS